MPLPRSYFSPMTGFQKVALVDTGVIDCKVGLEPFAFHPVPHQYVEITVSGLAGSGVQTGNLELGEWLKAGLGVFVQCSMLSGGEAPRDDSEDVPSHTGRFQVDNLDMSW